MNVLFFSFCLHKAKFVHFYSGQFISSFMCLFFLHLYTVYGYAYSISTHVHESTVPINHIVKAKLTHF